MSLQSRHLPTYAAFVGGFLLTFIATDLYGPGMGPDAVSYLSAGHNLIEQHAFYLYSGRLYMAWPPLFPMILSVLSLLPPPEMVTLQIFQSLVHGGIAALMVALVRREISGTALIWAVALFGVFGYPTLYLTKELYSGGLYILLSLATAYSFNRWIGYLKSSHFWLLVLFLTLSVLQRYIGITLLLTCTGLFFISFRYRYDLKDYITALGIPLFFLGIWLLRNLALTDTLTGERSEPFIDLFTNAWLGIVVFSKWMFPHFIPDLIRVPLLGIVIVGIIELNRRYQSDGQMQHPLMQFCIVYIGTYLIFLWSVSTAGASDALSFRLLSPVFPFVIIAFTYWLDAILPQLNRTLCAIIFTALLLGGLYHTYFSINMTRYSLAHGAGGFNSRMWHESPTMQWAQQNHSDKRLISNASDGLYLLADYPTQMTPFWSATEQDLDRFYSRYNGGYVVWFNNMKRGNLIPISKLKSRFNLTEIEQFEDGAVYRIPLNYND